MIVGNLYQSPQVFTGYSENDIAFLEVTDRIHDGVYRSDLGRDVTSEV